MGTTYTVTVPGADSDDEPLLAATVRDQLELVDALMSTYREDSEISRFNRHASSAPFPLSVETLTVLKASEAVSAFTAGAFDITVGRLVDAWGFGPSRKTLPPSSAEVDRLRRSAGWTKLSVNEVDETASKQIPDLQCDLSAIAKGYAVDRVADALAGLGFASHLVEVGGEVRASGTNPSGGPWRLGIEAPAPEGRSVQKILQVSDTGVATSGDYRNFREVGGLRLGHVLDPRSGRPATSRVASATVLDPSAMRADAFATALMVLGEEEGIRVAEAAKLPALLVVRDAHGNLRELTTRHFRARMNR